MEVCISRALQICKELIHFPSVTGTKTDILSYISDMLKIQGFSVAPLIFKSPDGKNVIENLYAEYGDGEHNLGFSGHLDVVPPGNGWNSNPFTATEKDGYLYGRGIADMKGGVACYIAALEECLQSPIAQSAKLSLFLTCDEEIGSYEGTQALLKWAEENKKIPTACLLGEPSSQGKIGDRIYIGHRGSLNINMKITGKQSHSAYVTDKNRDNSVEHIANYITKFSNYQFTHNDKRFGKTIASPTLLHVENLAENVIPPSASVNFNVRYSPDYTHDELVDIATKCVENCSAEISTRNSGEPYICEDTHFIQIAQDSISKIVGYTPELSTGGGTSDGRYIINHCPTLELGLVDDCIHQINEKAKIQDLEILKNIYKCFISLFFQRI